MQCAWVLMCYKLGFSTFGFASRARERGLRWRRVQKASSEVWEGFGASGLGPRGWNLGVWV